MTEDILPLMYPRLIRRIQACLIDSIVFAIIFFGSFLLVSSLKVESLWLKIIIIFLPIFILEPALVSVTGGTIGHHLIKLKVQNVNNSRNINILLASFRFILKSVLGTISLIFVLTTRRHQAIHDFLANSVVVYKDAKRVSEHEALVEREIEEEGYIYPSKLRRVFMIILYNVLLFIVISFLSVILMSEACIENNKCTPADDFASYVIGFIWLISLTLILVGGWKSLLFGCKRKRIEPS